MIRRASTVLTAAACAIALPGCATFTNDDVVATVDGTEIDQDTFDAVADDYFGRPDLFGTASPVDGRLDGEQARLLLGAVIRQQMFRDLTDESGVALAADREAFMAENFADAAFDELDPALRDLIADTNGGFQAEMLQRVPAASEDELRALYESDPLGAGMACLRHILVETEDEADEIIGLLDDGADFAELAADRSLDESTAANGGALASAENACVPLRTLAQGFDPGFAGAVFAAEGDRLIGPAESSFGWHVILHRPWDEVADSVVALHTETDSGGYLLDGRIATADVDVNPSYGAWDRLGGTVLPLG